MIGRSSVVVAAALLAACASVAGPPDEARVAGLAAAERAFAASARTDGVRAAFLAAMDDEATLFRPGPVAGRAYVESRPEPPYRLEWQPQRVAVAASDDLGWSTGPFLLEPDARPAARIDGQFFSVWRRAPDRRWQLLIDLGIAHPVATGWSAPLESVAGDGAAPVLSIDAAEAEFARTSATDGVAAAYRRHGSASLRVLRDGIAPIDGLEALASLPDAGARWRWTPTGSGTSSAGDLAWTTGRYRDGGSGSYVRVWHAEGGRWKVIGDVIAPIEDATH